MPPIAVVQILSTGGTVAIGVVREYLKKQLGREKEEIDSVRSRLLFSFVVLRLANVASRGGLCTQDRALITSYRTESQKKRRDIVELSDPNTPRIFQVTRCSACGGQLDLPSVHFMCRHSYHQRHAPSHCRCSPLSLLTTLTLTYRARADASTTLPTLIVQTVLEHTDSSKNFEKTISSSRRDMKCSWRRSRRVRMGLLRLRERLRRVS